MYEGSNMARIGERIKSVKLLKEITEEKNKIDKKYSSLMNDIKQFMNENEKRCSR
jgi:phosphate uptake regulator